MNVKLKNWNLLGMVAVSLLSGCDNLEQLDKRLNIKLDPAISKDKVDLLKADISRVASAQLTQPSQDGYFEKVFGTSDSSGILQFLDDRIHYVFPVTSDDDLKKRVVLKLFGSPIQDPHQATTGNSSNAPNETCGVDTELGKMSEDFKKATTSETAVVGASNVGTSLWMANAPILALTKPNNQHAKSNEALANAVSQLAKLFEIGFKIGNTTISLDSPRVGIVELGDGYSAIHHGKPVTSVFRSSILVHEARHSDCTGGYYVDDFMKSLQACSLPKDKECGHLHAICPEGHVLAGLPACDDAAWGAYSVGAIYARQIYNACANCSEEEKHEALAVATDSFGRVLVLKDMLAGKLGDPDMSSSDEVLRTDPKIEQVKSAVTELRTTSQEKQQ